MIDLGLLLTGAIILWICWYTGENYTNIFVKILLLAIGVSIFAALMTKWVVNPLAIVDGCEVDLTIFKRDLFA